MCNILIFPQKCTIRKRRIIKNFIGLSKVSYSLSTILISILKELKKSHKIKYKLATKLAQINENLKIIL